MTLSPIVLSSPIIHRTHQIPKIEYHQVHTVFNTSVSTHSRIYRVSYHPKNLLLPHKLLSANIARHADHERLLDPGTTPASFSLDAKIDFLLKHQAIQPGITALKFLLASRAIVGDTTKVDVLHPEAHQKCGERGIPGLINMFRKTITRERGTKNYDHENTNYLVRQKVRW
jgi:hypothetical protein